MQESKAERMFELISQAPMGKALRSSFSEMAKAGDADGMYDLFDRCLRSRRGKEVGHSVESAGQTSFESIEAEVRRVFEGAE